MILRISPWYNQMQKYVYSTYLLLFQHAVCGNILLNIIDIILSDSNNIHTCIYYEYLCTTTHVFTYAIIHLLSQLQSTKGNRK